jgi:hypothetical protein
LFAIFRKERKLQSKQKDNLRLVDNALVKNLEISANRAHLFQLINNKSDIILKHPEIYPFIALKLRNFDSFFPDSLKFLLLSLNEAYINQTGCDCSQQVCLFSALDAGSFPYSYDYFYKHFSHPVFLRGLLLHVPPEKKQSLLKTIINTQINFASFQLWQFREALIENVKQKFLNFNAEDDLLQTFLENKEEVHYDSMR